MPTRNVVLTQHQQEFIEALVSSGRYQNASEVLRDGLRLVEQREARDAEKLKALRQAAEKGWADVPRPPHRDRAEDRGDRLGPAARVHRVPAAAGAAGLWAGVLLVQHRKAF